MNLKGGLQMRRLKLTVAIPEAAYQKLRCTATFVHPFERSPETKIVLFKTKCPKKLCTDLDKLGILDISAAKAFGIEDRLR